MFVITKADCAMNIKNEWHQPMFVRIIPMTGLQEDQGAGRDSLSQESQDRGMDRGQEKSWNEIIQKQSFVFSNF